MIGLGGCSIWKEQREQWFISVEIRELKSSSCSWPQRESIQSFTNKYYVSYGVLSMTFITLRKFVLFLSISSLLSGGVLVVCFCQDRVLDFGSCSFSIEMTIWFVSFILLIQHFTVIDFHMLQQPCIPWINPTQLWYTGLFYVVGFSLTVFC